MATTFDFTPFERQLLKIAAKSASRAFKAAKSACGKAYLTQAESEAHGMEGYADEAVRFLENPEGIVQESTDDDATEEERRDVVKLVNGHIEALRTGCMIRINEIEDLMEDQTEIFADTDSTQERLKDFRRLESQLRGLNSPQADLFNKPAAESTAPTSDSDAPEAEQAEEPSGPFDASAVPERLALASGEPAAEEIPETDYEIIDDEAGDGSDDGEEVEGEDDEERGDPLTPEEQAEWLNEPLRTTPEDAAESDDLTS